MKVHILIFFQLLSFSCCEEASKMKENIVSFAVDGSENSIEYWKNKAQNYLAGKLNAKVNTNKAKNIIMFLGDGMGLSTVAATRMYMGKPSFLSKSFLISATQKLTASIRKLLTLHVQQRLI
jgi:alkaline phosphatase